MQKMLDAPPSSWSSLHLYFPTARLMQFVGEHPVPTDLAGNITRSPSRLLCHLLESAPASSSEIFASLHVLSARACLDSRLPCALVKGKSALHHATLALDMPISRLDPLGEQASVEAFFEASVAFSDILRLA